LNVPAYIARRYVFSKRNRNVVNLISGISSFVIGFVTLAMVVVLSAINGIESLIDRLYTSFDSEVFIYPKEGKTFAIDAIHWDTLQSIPGFIAASPVIEEAVLIEYIDQRQLATIKGIRPEFLEFSGMDSMMVYGKSSISSNGKPSAIMGYGLKYYLGIPGNPISPLFVYAPKRGKSIRKYKESSFAKLPIQLGGAFSISVEFDSRYVIVPLDFCQKLLGYENEISSIEIRTHKKDMEGFTQEVRDRIDVDKFKVVSRRQKNALVYQTTQSEKWASYSIITFIMLIAVFNVIASLTMLILEKRSDIFTLKAMGADNRFIRNIFYTEGILINLIGALAGLCIGVIVVLLQQYYHWVPLEGSIIDYYPVELRWNDLVIILSTVVFMGAISTIIPVRILSRKYH
jgi:lipoprotein-releasing system permease protein